MWSVPAVELTDAERVELGRRARAHTSSQRDAKRARIVLLAAEGVPNRQIAVEVAMSEQAVGKWRRRFGKDRLAGLNDVPGRGRPRVYDHDDRLRIVATATSAPPAPASHWSHAQLAARLAEEIGISASQIGRILADLDIKPHRVRGWITRGDDPEFWERAADVCALYLSPPENALVLSVDEKKAIVAREPVKPTTPVASGRPARREHEYVRHGKLDTLFTALEVHSGEVRAAEAPSNSALNFIGFLAGIDAAVSSELDIHLILDNGSSHVARATAQWIDEHPRFHAHYTPTYASWLNQVELFFSILQRRLLRRGKFSSVEDLLEKIKAYIAEYNRTARPFRWTYDGSPLKVA